MTVTLIHGNALTIPLADQSVHLIVSSPPYFSLRSYRDGDDHFDGQLGSEATPLHFLAALWAVMDECWRVLRDDGSAWINLGDKFSTGNSGESALAKLGERYRGGGHTDAKAKVRSAPVAGLRPKSRMLLPHLFAEGCQYPWLRRAVEHEAGIAPTADPPQWICRMDAVWSKPNGLPESVTDRVRASHEYWFHLVKSERYYAAVDEIREEHLHGGWGSSWEDPTYSPDNGHVGAMGHDNRMVGNPLGKLPGSVWEIPTEPLRVPDDLPQHFAAFPSEFPRRLILGWSPSGVCVACGEGRRPVCEKGEPVPSHPRRQGYTMPRASPDSTHGVGLATLGYARPATITGTACACPAPTAPTTPARILDPFSGTGTTAIVADVLGRHGIGVDLSWDYHRIARWRHQDGGLRAKALGVERPEKQLDGQLSLLGEAS